VIGEPELAPDVLQLLDALAVPQYPVTPASSTWNIQKYQSASGKPQSFGHVWIFKPMLY